MPDARTELLPLPNPHAAPDAPAAIPLGPGLHPLPPGTLINDSHHGQLTVERNVLHTDYDGALLLRIVCAPVTAPRTPFPGPRGNPITGALRDAAEHVYQARVAVGLAQTAASTDGTTTDRLTLTGMQQLLASAESALAAQGAIHG